VPLDGSMARTLHRLSAARVASAKQGIHADWFGLYLQCTVGADGEINKSWFFRFARNGRERRMGLGALHGVSLAKARELADAARVQHRQGIDPIAAREAQRQRHSVGVTFREAFETFFAAKGQSLLNAKHKAQWKSTMKTYVFPIIGSRAVAEVTTNEVLSVLAPIWYKKPETARRVLQRIEAVFKSAILRGHRQAASPCVGISQELGTRHRKVTNHRALAYAEIPQFLARLQSGPQWPVTRYAFEWLILTATRSSETRLARWVEVDEGAALWTIPAERMKAKRTHVVPLSARCLQVLRALRALHPSGPCDLLFPGTKLGAPLSDMTLTKVLRDMGLAHKATAHGMRSAFKNWSAEVAKVRDDVSEAALAHAVRERVRAACLRTDFLEDRKELMTAWARFCLTGETVPSGLPQEGDTGEFVPISPPALCAPH
jgi:integrase